MKKKICFFVPRILGLFLFLFFSVFALDTEILSIGFLIHMLPGLIILSQLIIFWKKGFYSSISFLILFLLSVVFFNTYRQLEPFLIVSLPLLVISGFYFLDYKISKPKT